MRKLYIAIAAALLFGWGAYEAVHRISGKSIIEQAYIDGTFSSAYAQRGTNTFIPDQTVAGFVSGRSTVNASGTIASGSTFQQLLPSIIAGAGNAGTARQSLTIQNSNTNTDNCWVYIGPIASATKGASILLAPQQAYGRYWPNVPSDQISITCTGTSDTFYADYQ